MPSLGTGSKTLILLACCVLIVAGLKAAAPLLLPLLMAVFLTTLSLPITRFFERHRVPSTLAITLAMFVNLSVIAVVVILIANSITNFSDTFPTYQDKIVAHNQALGDWLQHRGIQIPPNYYRRLTNASWVMSLVSALLRSLTQLISETTLILLLVMFMLLEVGRIGKKLDFLYESPGSMPPFARAVRETQKYLLVKTIVSLVTGILCGLLTWILKIDFPLLWGLLAFLLNYIPNLGSVVAAVPPALIALVQLGPGTMLAVLIGYIVINFVIGNIVEPRIFGKALGLSPLVVFVSMMFWGWLWGPMGALLSVPLTMVIKIALANSEELRWIAIFLGSATWVEEKHREWSREEEEAPLTQGPLSQRSTKPSETGFVG
jgi:AI-2 transport protein TqsA